MLKQLLYIVLLLVPVLLFSQDNEEVEDGEVIGDSLKYVQYYIIEGDTIPYDAIGLDEVVVMGKLNFKDNIARRRYLILRRKTRKVYPFAKLAADRLESLNERLLTIKSKRARKKYVKRLQNYMEDEFADKLKKYSRTEGQILVKLVHRQTGLTMFDLVKEYRSGWSAFWYNSTANLFDISLKEIYDPINVEEDYWIEDILQRSFQSNLLEEQKTALDFSFYDLRYKWNDLAPSITKKTVD